MENWGMSAVETYEQLAERANTRRSYSAAVKHFEVEGRGSLPATPEAVAAYLAQFAESLSITTLKVRLAGLANWHKEHGFTDPTRSPQVLRVLKGIRSVHNRTVKQARPIEFQLLEQLANAIQSEIDQSSSSDPGYLKLTRDKAMLLIGFWRGFRADELTRLQFEHVSIREGIGMQCYLPYSKGDRESSGRSFFCPALSRLCPVDAFQQWQSATGKTSGPVFRRVDRWGHVADRRMAPGSVVPWLRSLFLSAGVKDAHTYSSHSLRRGFANWAKTCGWDIKELMTYVGWRDVSSALRYLELSEQSLADRFEQGLTGDRNSEFERTLVRGKPPITAPEKRAGAKVIVLHKQVPE